MVLWRLLRSKRKPGAGYKILLSGKFLLLNKYQLAYFIQNVDEDMHSYMSGIGEEIKQHCNVEILPCRRVIDIVSLEKRLYMRIYWKGINHHWNLTS